MTLTYTRSHEISDLEGFDIRICDLEGTEVGLRTNGLIGPYPFKRRLKDNATVKDWCLRFACNYRGYTARIFYADGSEAAPQTLLGTVRERYAQDAISNIAA